VRCAEVAWVLNSSALAGAKIGTKLLNPMALMPRELNPMTLIPLELNPIALSPMKTPKIAIHLTR
jgi:hypothetical protein